MNAILDEPREVSDASQRLRALAASSGSLTDPLTPEEAAEIIERHALAALGATSAVVVTLGHFPPNGPSDSSSPPAVSPDAVLPETSRAHGDMATSYELH